MTERTLPAAAAAAVLLVSATAAFAGEVDLLRAPSLSPDGREVVFTWRGDLWKASTTGGHATRLTSHPADDTRSAWSPDGKTIAFESERSGAQNLWLMDADGSNVRPVTKEDGGISLTGWMPDGAALIVSARIEGDVYPEPRPYVVAVAGGPLRRLFGAFGRETVVRGRSPNLLAFVRGGSSPTRRGYRGPDNRDVWIAVRVPDAASVSGPWTFRRLTDWAGNDLHPQWTQSGNLLFTSDRDLGTQNVFGQRVSESGTADGAPVRLTSFEGQDVWDVATASAAPVAVCVVWGRLHRIDLAASPPKVEAVTITAADDEGDRTEVKDVSGEVTEARLSPDGKTLAVIAYGDVFVRNVEEKHPTRRVTATAAREREIAWSPDGSRLWFVHDAEDGRPVVCAATVVSTRAEIRERFDRATGAMQTEPPKPEEKPEEKKPDEPKAAEAQESEDAAKPEAEKEDDEKPAEETKDVERKPDAKPRKSAKPKPKTAAEKWPDAVLFRVENVLDDPPGVRRPTPSPDGRSLAVRRGGDVLVLDLETKALRPVVKGFDVGTDFQWSPDSAWIAYATDDRDFNSDVWVVRADGSAPAVNVSRHPSNDFSPRWSADGKVLAFLSERTDREVDVWRVLLDRKLEALPPEEFAQWQKDAAAAAKKRKPPLDVRANGRVDVRANRPANVGASRPAEPDSKTAEPSAPDLDDAWKRLVRVTTLRGNEGNLEILPGGDGFVFRGKNGSDEGLFACNFDGTNLRRLVAGQATAQHVTLNGESVVHVSGGKAATVPAAGGATKALDVAAKVTLERDEKSEQRFVEAARIVGDLFYDGAMKGLDWAATTAKWLPLARRTRTADEFNFVANAFLGELNASHLAITMRGGRAAGGEPNGRLGVDWAPAPGGFRIERIVPDGPADRGPMKLAAGDVVTAVDGRAVVPADTLESALVGRTGKETLLTVRREVAGAAKELQVLVTPIAAAADNELRYDAWAAANERTVHELSQKRLGYLHIRQMNETSLQDFERDLYAAAAGHEGLVLDVRNNGGGSTADLILASLMVQPHAYTVPRGADPSFTTGYPRDRLWIQRYVLPANLLCNEKSFSNAEILAHAFRTLRRGTLVGQTTYGGVISTGGESTLDGTWVRTPFRGWFLPDGTDMENHGARPDLLVPQTPEAESRGDDEQLRAAAEDLLKRLK